MTNSQNSRITITLPKYINDELDISKKELGYSKNEIIKMAIENFLEERKKAKLQNAVDIMQNEYKSNSELTAFTALDGEDFIWSKKRFGL